MEFLQIAQTAQQIGGLSLLTTGLLLGVRHGIDWDHIAAITDIASTTTSGDVAGAAVCVWPCDRRLRPGPARAVVRGDPARVDRSAHGAGRRLHAADPGCVGDLLAEPVLARGG